jgi:hypothetical protein
MVRRIRLLGLISLEIQMTGSCDNTQLRAEIERLSKLVSSCPLCSELEEQFERENAHLRAEIEVLQRMRHAEIRK